MTKNNKNPLVTVVVPAYNHEDFVEGCVESILSQDYKEIELFVINDGSTDGTGKKIEDLCKKYGDRINYINKENEGLISSLNIALHKGRGKYFCELASDDSWVEGSLSARVEFLENNTFYDAVFGDIYYVENGIRTDKRLVSTVKYGGYDSKKHNVNHLLEIKRMIVFPTGLFKRQVLIDIGAFDDDFRNFEDIATRYKLVAKAKVGYIDEPLLWYRKHDANVSASSKHFLSMKEESMLALEKLLTETSDGQTRSHIKKKLFRRYIGYLKLGLNGNIPTDKLSGVAQKAVTLNPWSLKARYYKVVI